MLDIVAEDFFSQWYGGARLHARFVAHLSVSFFGRMADAQSSAWLREMWDVAESDHKGNNREAKRELDLSLCVKCGDKLEW